MSDDRESMKTIYCPHLPAIYHLSPFITVPIYQATLDAFLDNPRAAVPRTKMGYAGIKDAQERADLIAYLRLANEPGGDCS